VQDFVFLDAYGRQSDNGSLIAGRYNYTASSTAVVTNQTFGAMYHSASGSKTVTDTIQFSSLSVSNLTFGDANAYDKWVSSLGVAGSIGISPFPTAYATNLPSTFVSQIANSTAVDKPLVSLSLVVSTYNLTSNTGTSTGQITVGAEDGDACTAGGYTYVANNMTLPTSFRVDSITGTAANGDSLSLSVNPSRMTTIDEVFPDIYASNDFIQLLVNASGLVYQGNDYYEMASCDDVQNVGSLTLNLASNSTLTLNSQDYIYQNITSDGSVRCGAYLASNGRSESDNVMSPIGLGQLFLNNHCYTHNYADGTIGIASTVNQTVAVVSY